jgi:alpha-L-rhamnosidase
MTNSNPLANFPRGRDWDAHWIWNAQAPARNAWVLFRCEFDLADTTDARLFISADTRYRVWINGQYLGDGPPQSQPYHQYYDERDIVALVQPGHNCIAVIVQHQGVQDSARGGLLAEILDGQDHCVSASGGDWRCLLGSAWKQNANFCGMNRIGPFQEHVDLRALPVGWMAVGFDDSGWQEPSPPGRGGTDPWCGIAGSLDVPLVMPWCRLVPRDIDHIVETDAYATAVTVVEECIDLATRRDPGDLSMSLSQAGRPVDWATVEGTEALLSPAGECILACSDRHQDMVTDGRYDPCITLDFGRVLTGYAEVEVVAAAGAKIEIGYAERLIDGRFNNSIECPFGDCATFVEGENLFRPLIWRSFRYLRLRVKHSETALRIRAVRAVEVNYPYEDRGAYRGRERLEQVFDICRTTLKLCSIESLMDTPYREQAQWLGDVAAVTVPGIYACFGDTALPGKFLRQSALNTKPTGLIANISNVSSNSWEHDIPDYSLWWIICLWRHYEYTGDARYVHECYPEMQRIMRVHLERIQEDGLLAPMFGWVFIDWAHVDVLGVSSAYNAIFAGACDAAVKLAAVKGDAWAQGVYANAATGIRSAFTEAFLDAETGLLVDAVYQGERSDRYSEQSNTAAIAFDCVDDVTSDAIIDALFGPPQVRIVEAQPFFMVVVLEALRKRGRMDLALQLIDERWGKRMVDRGRTSCTEEWYENGSWRSGDWHGFQRTHSHAWSAAAAEFLITGLAGISILEPGCSALQIQPFSADDPYEVIYPTPKGPVRVTWDGGDAEIHAPDGVRVQREGK